jgi:DNA-binding transcriptional LysR family regulator
VLAEFHRRYPDVRLELTTGTNDALVAAVAERRLDAAFVAEPPGPGFAQLPAFHERLVVISSVDHPPITRARDAAGLSVISFPSGCAYRRALERWLGRDSLAALRVLELGSYHAIVACVAAGTGIALMPEAVLDAMPQVRVRRHPIAKAQANIVTPLIWRDNEASPPVRALRTLMADLVAAERRRGKRPRTATR